MSKVIRSTKNTATIAAVTDNEVILDVGNVFSLAEKKELFADPKIGDGFVVSVTIESLDDEKKDT